MLSIKTVKIHGMKDKRWTLRDKLNQYRGIIKLNKREKKIKKNEASRNRKRISRELNKLKNEVKNYREIVKEVQEGDSRRIHTLLQGHKDFMLALENKNPGTVYKAVSEDVCLRRNQLDKLYNLKRQKIREFFNLKLECTELEEKYEEQNRKVEPDKHQQKIVALYQKYIGEEKSAKATTATYNSILKILVKDGIYYNALLDALQSDRDEQCKVIYSATLLGQLAAEDLDDTREKYKKLAKDVWFNMKEREKTLKITRNEVEKLWANCRSLVRVESLNELKKIEEIVKKNDKIDDNNQLEMKKLEETFVKVKNALMVRSYDELLTRFEEQANQRERLLEKFKSILEKHSLILDKKNKASMILANLDHSMVTTTGDYKTNKKYMLDEIINQNKRELDYKKLRKTRGELLINIKAGLQNMIGLLIHIKPGKNINTNKKTTKDNDKKKKSKKKIIKDDKDSDDDTNKNEHLKIEKIETNAINLLDVVTKKSIFLYNLSNFDLEDDQVSAARKLYQKYVENFMTKLKYGDGEPEPTGIHVEHEIIDTTVQTRVSIKNRSKQIVETNSRLH
ncbi:hypothetical protein HCN44_001136 [Aphidius gifuensis]|uniref:Uncharacterized protein n=1 Tax=Aphidius gifuensis TaxID=684658 RepID=A0A835CNW8_APHGI|nr:structural maintenance of chromosomes protein 2-like [Aphidius gifuensis]KAF7988563.1 hypothetical protein HCN44_001136 [Aphidius gifuensis]